MAGRTLMVLDVRELLRRLRAGQTDRAIKRATGTARKTVGRYREIAAQQGWLDGPLPELPALEATTAVQDNLTSASSPSSAGP